MLDHMALERIERQIIGSVQTRDAETLEAWGAVVRDYLEGAQDGQPGDVRCSGTLKDKLLMLAALKPQSIVDDILTVTVPARVAGVSVPVGTFAERFELNANWHWEINGSPLRMQMTERAA